jgi:hypothetical protein
VCPSGQQTKQQAGNDRYFGGGCLRDREMNVHDRKLYCIGRIGSSFEQVRLPALPVTVIHLTSVDEIAPRRTRLSIVIQLCASSLSSGQQSLFPIQNIQAAFGSFGQDIQNHHMKPTADF